MPKPRRRRRFFALGDDRFQIESSGEEQTASRTSLTGEEPDVADETASGRVPSADAAHFAVKPTLAKRLRASRRASIFRAAALVLLGAVLGGLGVYFVAPLPAVRSTGNPARNEAALLTPEEQRQLDAAYTARDARRFAEAEQLFTALAHSHPQWSELRVEIGRTLLYRRNYLGARAALNAVVGQGMEQASASLYTAVAYNAERSYLDAESGFARSVALDPTQPDAYFLWGECLREQGKLADAIPKYRAALLRNEDETGAGLYRLKLWLCEIEANQNNGANAEIDAALARPFPPMEALFAAAARELKAGDLRAAAAHLLRARERTDPQVFLVVLSDPFFVQARLKPELSETIRSLAPASAPPSDGRSAPP